MADGIKYRNEKQKSLILDKEFQENKLEVNITNWPKKIMSA